MSGLQQAHQVWWGLVQYSINGNSFSKFKMVAALTVTVLFLDKAYASFIGFATFSPSLVRIGQVVMNWQLFSKIKMAAATIINPDHCAIFQHNRCVLHRIRNIPTKIGEDWSNNEGIVTAFRNSKWRQSPSWVLATALFFDNLFHSSWTMDALVVHCPRNSQFKKTYIIVNARDSQSANRHRLWQKFWVHVQNLTLNSSLHLSTRHGSALEASTLLVMLIYVTWDIEG